MESKGLTISIIFEANSLKKMARRDGEQYTYISRQALRYSLVKNLGWDNTDVTMDNKVVQFAPDATIDVFPEIDFFGYMKTMKGESAHTRAAICRMSHGISLEPYKSDLDYLTNMGLSSRIEDGTNAIAQSEIHQSHYAYTVTIDLDLVGVDGDVNIENGDKAERVKELLRGIKLLHRDIRGRRENLNPLLVIGGVYDYKNPYFEGRLILEDGRLATSLIQETLELDDDVKNNTICGYVGNIFKNDDEVKGIGEMGIGEFFKEMDKKVDEYYESN